MTTQNTDAQKELFKKALWFINAHRDGCCGQYVAKHLNITENELFVLFREMLKQELIYFPNVSAGVDPTEDELLDSLVFISGGYTHPDYKDIY